ncbi:MAG: hypothetical protein IPK82_30325 [Polyangiaceae bacterium]|nr:hypothetical protein [Polyangiaceae bacterium]
MSRSTQETSIAVTALGMVTSLGLDAVSSLAAARAGITNPTDLKVMRATFGSETEQSPPVLKGHVVPGVGTGFVGIGKVIALGAAALRDLIQRRRITPRELSRTSLHLVLSDHAVLDAHSQLPPPSPQGDEEPVPLPSTEWKAKISHIHNGLLRAAETNLSEKVQSVLPLGSPGVARAVEDAIHLLRSGSVERCIVGGVDSRVEPRFLLAAGELGLLKTNDYPVGLIPGESAAFFMLERTADIERSSVHPLATISGGAWAQEPESYFGESAATGRALSRAILDLLGKSPTLAQSLAFHIAELNGTERRAMEWGNALNKLRAHGAQFDLPMWLPIASFGDVGAATGAVSICMAARALERGYAPGRGALVWTCSESGAAGAVGVEAAR